MTSLSLNAHHTLAYGVYADALHGVYERIVGVREIHLIVNLFQSGLARRAVLELQRADARLDFVRRGDRGGNCGGRLRGGYTGQCRYGAGYENCQGRDDLLHRFVSLDYGQDHSRV
jgi:hypothetical protein